MHTPHGGKMSVARVLAGQPAVAARLRRRRTDLAAPAVAEELTAARAA